MARAASLSSRSAISVRSPRAPPMRRSGRSMRPSDGIGRPGDDGPVGLLHLPAAEGSGELRRGAGRAGEQQHAGGVAVQPVHQARAVRRAEAQRVEQGVQMVGDARAALHRHAVRLVQHQQVVVAMDHQALQVAGGVRIDRGRGGLRVGWRGQRRDRAPTGPRRAGSRPRRGGRPRAPGRCGTASGSRPASGRESGGGTSGPGGCRLRRRRPCGRRPSPPPPLAGGVGGGGVFASQRDRQQRIDLVAVQHHDAAR